MTNLKRLWLIPFVALALFLVVGTGAAQQMPQVDPALANSKQFQRWWWAFQQRAYPLDDIPKDAKLRALQQIEQFKASQPPALQAILGNRWVNIGPAPIEGGETDPPSPVSGRVAAIAVHPDDPNHWLIGAAQGGVWRTRNGGMTWTPLTDDQASLAMGAIAFAPSDPNIIYAGTGEAPLGSNDSYPGAGLLKSTDGGNTWTLLAHDTFSKTSFSDIKVHPTNPDILLAATVRGGRDRVFPPSVPPRGIFKSTDGGVTWSRKLGDRGATDLEVDPTNFNNQYAAVFVTPLGNDVVRSTDAGETWNLISGPWEMMTDRVVRVELAIAPSDPNVLYVSIDSRGNLLGLFRTDNAWNPTPLWTQIISAPGYCEPRCDYAHEIIVDPTDPDTLYAGGITLWKCETCSAAAATWTEITNDIHVDQQTMAWAGDRLIVGNDGGVWSTIDGGDSWTNHNTNLSITQFYKGSLHPSDPNFALGGSQDNGTEKWTGTNAWQWIFRGDGSANAISSSNSNTHWAVSSQKLNIYRTRDGGASFTAADSGIDKTGAPFIAPFEKCPANDDVFIAGTNKLWKSTNFFSGGSPSWSSNGPEMGVEITALAFAPSDPTCNTYAFGTSDGRIRFTSDGGSKWVDIDRSMITEFPVPFRDLQGITAGPDRALWFTGRNRIGRITTDGTVTRFPIPDGRGAGLITAGSDGALWFTMGTSPFSGSIGRMTPAGVFTEFPLPTPMTRPWGITAGRDGALWFTATTTDPGPPNRLIGRIGRITTDGAITEFRLPKDNDQPVGITAGPDGALWFTEFAGRGNWRTIGRITTGGVITEFRLPETTGNPFSAFITAGPDGALWFTEDNFNDIVRITTAGAFTLHPLPPSRRPNGITKGPDDALWFTEGVGKIGRMTTDGKITEFQMPRANTVPFDITVGPDDALWFTEFNGDKIGRIGDLLPHRFVTGLAFDPMVDPENPNAFTLYVTLSGFDEGTPRQPGHVFKGKFKIRATGDLDTIPTWTNVTPKDADGHPVNIPHNTIVLDPADPDIVYVGTDIGVWTSDDGGSTWTHMGPETGMPNVAIFDLQMSDTTGRLVAFTHGRGAFVLE